MGTSSLYETSVVNSVATWKVKPLMHSTRRNTVAREASGEVGDGTWPTRCRAYIHTDGAGMLTTRWWGISKGRQTTRGREEGTEVREGYGTSRADGAAGIR
jgi:hypothetical protein